MRRSFIAVWPLAGLLILAIPIFALAQSPAPSSQTAAAPSPQPAGNSRLDEAQRVAILRQLIAVAGTARRPLPMDKHGVELSTSGDVLNVGDVRQSLLEHGPADQVGERVVITGISFKGDRIVFDFNGGPLKTHWWDHLAVGINGASNPMNQLEERKTHGAAITLRFPHAVPAVTAAQLKNALEPLVDWAPARIATVMVQPLPPAVKTAITQHRVLVGMDTAMVIAALGRTNRKVRQTDPDDGQSYENWIYGEPPSPTTFVRVVADRVVRVTIWRPDGSKTELTQPDPAFTQMAQSNAPYARGATASSGTGDNPPPTLRRPGDPEPGQEGPGIGNPGNPTNPGNSTPGFPGGVNPGDPNDPNFPASPSGLPGASQPGFPGASQPGFPGASSGPPSPSAAPFPN